MLLIGDWPGSSQLVWLRDAAVGIQFAPDEDGDNTAEAHARSVSAIGAGDHDRRGWCGLALETSAQRMNERGELVKVLPADGQLTK